YQKFEGTWTYKSVEFDGNPEPESAFKRDRLILKGDRFRLMRGGNQNEGSFLLDPSVKPKTITISFKQSGARGMMRLGIYDLDGDTCKVCLGLEGKPRPSEFVSKPGSGHVLEVLIRSKP